MSQDRPASEETSPYLTGSYAPCGEEIAVERLEVVGQIPDDLAGVFVRTGSNPRFAPRGRYHWFDGDGMIHAVHFEKGRASYRNRYVRTAGLLAEEQAGRALWTGLVEPPDLGRPGGPYKDTGNTDVTFHAGQLLALWWMSGSAHVIRLPDLATVGTKDFGGGITAHPKVDPVTGEMRFIDYGPRPPYLTYGVVGRHGQVVHRVPVELASPRLQHDLAITENYTVLMDLSMMADPKELARGKVRVRFFRDVPTRFGLIPRLGKEVRWFSASPCYMYHTINAWEEAGDVVLVGCKIENPLQGDPDNAKTERVIPTIGHLRLEPYLYRWRFHLESGRVTEDKLDDIPAEFPRMNDGWLGRKTRYSYLGRIAPLPQFQFDAVIKHDTDGATKIHEHPRGWYGGEVAFAPRVGAKGEDDGYLCTYVIDDATGASELHVLEAPTLNVVARVKIPQRVPTGFHTTWVSMDELDGQRAP
jgi:carotenoid cleavage dioxygenase